MSLEKGAAPAKMIYLEKVTEEMLTEYLKTFCSAVKLSDLERKQFMQMAILHNLNPFKREIYCIPYGKDDKRKLSIITGYETYLKRAERSKSLDGWRTWTEGELIKEESFVKMSGSRGSWDKPIVKWGGSLKACIEIRRKDRAYPFYHEVLFTEYAQDTEIWRTKPTTMIKKVVIAQGFRMCFSDEFCGMPYTADELPDEMVRVNPVVAHESNQGQILDAKYETIDPLREEADQNRSQSTTEQACEETPSQDLPQAQKPERPPYWEEKGKELKALFDSKENGKSIFIAEEVEVYRQRWKKISFSVPEKIEEEVDDFIKEIKKELAERVSSTPKEKAFIQEFNGTVEAKTPKEEIRSTGPAVGECGQQGLGVF